MIQHALQKLQKEVADNPQDGYVRYIAAELIKYVRENPDKAQLFAEKEKSIKGSLAEMEKAAMKVKKGNSAMFTPDEGMAIVLKYFGVKVESPAEQVTAPMIEINVDLDDLLL